MIFPLHLCTCAIYGGTVEGNTPFGSVREHRIGESRVTAITAMEGPERGTYTWPYLSPRYLDDNTCSFLPSHRPKHCLFWYKP